VDALVQRTRERGNVVGLGEQPCEKIYVDRQADVRTGDLVVSSGLAEIFPKGLIVGRVTEVESRGYGLFKKVMMEPAVQINKLEEVLILGRGGG
jgi:rod shape-determining protein MreC